MRILVVSNMYPPHHLGGYELSCRDVMDRLRARGYEITVLTTTMRVPGVEDPPDERARGIRRDLEFYWEDHRLLSPPLLRRAQIERANQRALRAALQAAHPDVVSIWNMGAMSLGLLSTLVDSPIPLLFAVCDDWLIYGRELDAWTRIFRTRPAIVAKVAAAVSRVPATVPDLTRAGTFCFVTDFIRRRAKEKGGVDPAVATVVYSGIDRTDFPRVTPAPHGWSGRLLCVGRIDGRKGVDVAIRALALLPDGYTLTVLGRGDEDYARSLVDLAAQLGANDRVTFGVVPRDRLREEYARADVTLFPVVWDEPFGLVPIESMACGTPAVATGMGGSAEFLFDERNCLLVPPGDPAALAAAVTRLEGDPALRARLVEGGMRLADELTIDRLADTFEAWHVATSEGFANGRPPDRPSPEAAIAGG